MCALNPLQRVHPWGQALLDLLGSWGLLVLVQRQRSREHKGLTLAGGQGARMVRQHAQHIIALLSQGGLEQVVAAVGLGCIGPLNDGRQLLKVPRGKLQYHV